MKWIRRIAIALLVLIAIAVAGIVALVRWGQKRADLAAQVSDGGVYAVRNFYVDLYAVKNGSTVIMFDTGIDDSGHAIDTLLAGLNAKREDVTDLFLTHGHPDHFMGAKLLPNAKIHAGAADVPLYDGSKANPRLLPRVLGKILPDPPRLTIDHPLAGTSSITIGSETIVAVPIPGHTPGSYAYLVRDAVIAGDAIHYHHNTFEGPPDVFTEDPAQAMESIDDFPAKIKQWPVLKICTGHGSCAPYRDPILNKTTRTVWSKINASKNTL